MTFPLPAQDGAPCVFCRPELQPERLFETDSLYVIPDKYPLVPGHTLIITKSHVRCYGMARNDHLSELERAIAIVRPFLERSYGAPVIVLENGIAGQSVFHAHFHLIPVTVPPITDAIVRHEHVTEIETLTEIKDYLVLRGHYRYLAVHDRRYLLAGYSPVIRRLRDLLQEATGLTFGAAGWEKRTTPNDVAEVTRRWGVWTADFPDL